MGLLTGSLKNLTGLYVGDRLERAQLDKAEAREMLNLLPILARNDRTVSYYMRIINHYDNGEIDKIVEMLSPERFMPMGAGDKSAVERMIFNVKGLPEGAMNKYYDDVYLYYKELVERMGKGREN